MPLQAVDLRKTQAIQRDLSNQDLIEVTIEWKAIRNGYAVNR